MDKIIETIKEKKEMLAEYYRQIDCLKNEIKMLEEKKYLMCDHKFQLYPVYSGPYPEREYVCTKCGYRVDFMV